MMDPKLRKLAEAVLAWWDEHRYDVEGDYGEHNVYWEDPEFVTLAEQYMDEESDSSGQ